MQILTSIFPLNQCVSRNPPLRSLCIPREGLPFYLACRSAINLGCTLGLPLSQPLSIQSPFRLPLDAWCVSHIFDKSKFKSKHRKRQFWEVLLLFHFLNQTQKMLFWPSHPLRLPLARTFSSISTYWVLLLVQTDRVAPLHTPTTVNGLKCYSCPTFTLISRQSVRSEAGFVHESVSIRYFRRSCTLPGCSLHDRLNLTQPCSNFGISGGRYTGIPRYNALKPL